MRHSFPTVEVDAGKFLHQINVGAHAQIALFEERITMMGKELGANWHLLSLDQKNVIIKDTDNNKFYAGIIESIGKGRVKVTDIKEVIVVESKKEGLFKKNVTELINALHEDKLDEADGIFNKITRQRFRANVIPESGQVTTRDGRTHYVPVKKEIVKEHDRAALIKRIASHLNENVKVSRGRIVEATFNDEVIRIPITEMTRRKVVASIIKENTKKAYLSEGFQNRIKHLAMLLSDNKVQDTIDNVVPFLEENQEFSLLTLKEIRQLVEDSLAAQCCFNESLAHDIGTVIYRSNCKVNKETIIKEWKATARMTEYAPFVENVRKLEESADFEKEYNDFLNAMFVESSRDVNLEASEHLITLRKIRDILTTTDNQNEDLQRVDDYIKELEIKRDNVDDATIMEVRNFLSGLSEEVIEAAVALDGYSNPNIGTMSGFDAMPSTSEADPKMFGATDTGGATDLGGIGSALPMGGEEEELGGVGDTSDTVGGIPGGEMMGAEGELGTPEGEGEAGGDEEGGADPLAGLFDSKQRSGKTVTEAVPPQFKEQQKGGEDESEDESEDKKPAEDDKKPGKKPWQKPWEKKTGSEGAACSESLANKIKEAVGKLTTEGLQAELEEWSKNAGTFIKEDGLSRSTVQLAAYAARAKALKEEKLAKQFENILVANTPSQVSVVEETEDDPYAYDLQESKPKESEDGLGAGKPGTTLPQHSGKSMGVQVDGKGKGGKNSPNTMTPHPEATLKSGDKKGGLGKVPKPGMICCGECKAEHRLAECLKEDTAICPSCGADVYDLVIEAMSTKTGHKMDSPEGSGLQKKSVGQVKISGGGDKPSNESPEGKGLVKPTLKKSDGTSAPKGGGKKDGMDGQEGKPISGGVKGEVEEGSRKPPTSRKTVVYPFNGPAGFTTEEQEADAAVARIVEAMGDDDEDLMGDDDLGGEGEVEEVGDVGEPVGGEEVLDVADAGATPAVGAGPDVPPPPTDEMSPEPALGGNMGKPTGLDIDTTDVPPEGAGEGIEGSADDGTFVATVPAGTTEIVLNLPGAEMAGPEISEPLTPPTGEEDLLPPAEGAMGAGPEEIPTEEPVMPGAPEEIPEEPPLEPEAELPPPGEIEDEEEPLGESKVTIPSQAEAIKNKPTDTKDAAQKVSGNPRPKWKEYDGTGGKAPKAKSSLPKAKG